MNLSEAMLRVARRKNRFANATFVHGDAAALPFEDASFDASCISFALHEMPASVRERVIREMARVTKPAGRVVIVDYALPRNRVTSWLAFHVIELFEHKAYASFATTDLHRLLDDAGVELSSRRYALLGMAQIVTGRRR